MPNISLGPQPQFGDFDSRSSREWLYRVKAEEMKKLARGARDPLTRNQFLVLARGYEALADKAAGLVSG